MKYDREFRKGIIRIVHVTDDRQADDIPKVSVPECAKWVKRAGFKPSRYSPGILYCPTRREVVDRPSEVGRFVGIRRRAEGRKYVNGGNQR